MTVIAKNKEDGKIHVFLGVEKIEYFDEFYNDEDVALLLKTEEIHEGGARYKSKVLNKNYKIEVIEETLKEVEKKFIEYAEKSKFIVHEEFLHIKTKRYKEEE